MNDIWEERVAHTSRTETLPNGAVRIKNVRDWTFAEGKELTKGWKNEVLVRPEHIEKIWFLLQPFPYWEGAGHTYLTFEFKDGTALSFSIEARIKKGDSYNPFIGGVLGAYGISYLWGTERDFVTRRILFLKHSLYMYPLDIKHETAVTLVRAFVETTESHAESEKPYHTISDNCTNLLARIIDDYFPKRLPYDISWNFPGYSDFYLMKHDVIKTIDNDRRKTRDFYDLTPLKNTIAQFAEEPNDVFSKKLRIAMEERHKELLS